MDKCKICLVLLLCGAVTVADAARERNLRFQNSLRIGYDDNVYQSENNEQDTLYLRDIVTLTGKANFSSRTDAQIYWQPEFLYRFDADPDFVFYQTLFAGLNHAVSQRLFVRINDSLRWQEKEGESAVTTDQRYFRNTLRGSADYTINSVSHVSVNAGYAFNVWEEDLIGGSDVAAGNTEGSNNDYEQITAGVIYDRELNPNVTHGLLGMNYIDHSYDGSRGGYDSITVFGGATHNFSPHVTGNARAGYSFGTVENSEGDNDITTPYGEVGLAYNPSARTQINGSLGYSFEYADNSFWNVSEQFDATVGVRHDLTAKVSVSSSLAYIMSFYETDYLSVNGEGRAEAIGDVDDRFIRFTLRGSYQLNRNNFLDAGYEYTTRATDSDLLKEYDRNRFDIGWRIRL
jgi:hypothetical protein